MRYITLILSMKPQQHEFKVMGLAPYADQNIKKSLFRVKKISKDKRVKF